MVLQMSQTGNHLLQLQRHHPTLTHVVQEPQLQAALEDLLGLQRDLHCKRRHLPAVSQRSRQQELLQESQRYEAQLERKQVDLCSKRSEQVSSCEGCDTQKESLDL